jgi:virulence-associated protein VapD
MSVISLRPPHRTAVRAPIKATRVYAIAFDLDTVAAERVVGENWRACYAKIGQVLSEHGFERQQGSVYFGDERSNAVTCVQAAQDLDARFSWFRRIIRDLRMLRIDEDNDLLPALSGRLRLSDTGTE